MSKNLKESKGKLIKAAFNIYDSYKSMMQAVPMIKSHAPDSQIFKTFDAINTTKDTLLDFLDNKPKGSFTRSI